MKKILFSLGVLSLLIQLPVFAEETKQEAMSATLTNQFAAIPTPGIERKGNPMQNQLVSTNDGGVIVLAGFRLMKYDADLNLVKEVQIAFPKFRATDKPTPAAAKADQPPVATELQEKVV